MILLGNQVLTDVISQDEVILDNPVQIVSLGLSNNLCCGWGHGRGSRAWSCPPELALLLPLCMCTPAMAVSALARGRTEAQAGSVGRQEGLKQEADVGWRACGAVLAGWPEHEAVFSLLFLC